MHGHMAEAQKGFAILEDIDEGTFVRFIEWAYKGFYTAAEFKRIEAEQQSHVSGNQNNVEVDPTSQLEEHYQLGQTSEPQMENDPFSEFMAGVKLHKKGKKGLKSGIDTTPQDKTELKEAFIRRRYTVRQSILHTPPSRANQSQEEDYTDVFLSHARLYVFADKYDIQSLKTLAMEELHATLAIFTLHRARTGDIVALLRYIYGNTNESRKGTEDMRTLMTQYLGLEMDTLIRDEDFKDLMIKDGGALLGDFMRMVGKRIS